MLFDRELAGSNIERLSGLLEFRGSLVRITIQLPQHNFVPGMPINVLAILTL